ncbi:MAG TPA: hypothetical protein VFP49_06325 [Nitrososphaeraceae archaeon]|nr:hypothetical protein [Nitrososphaeraceae archaeon]
MVDRAQVLDLLRRNAEYGDLTGSTQGVGGCCQCGAGYIGGCMCGRGYIGGAYIGGARKKSTPASRIRKKLAMIEALERSNPPPSQGRRPRIPKIVRKPRALKQLEMLEAMVPTPSLRERMPLPLRVKNTTRECVRRGLGPSGAKRCLKYKALDKPSLIEYYRRCLEYKNGPSGAKRCASYKTFGKPPRTAAQRAATKRLLELNAELKIARQLDPSITREEFFASKRM